MKEILLFRHESWIEAPHLTDLLEDISIPYSFVKVDEGEEVPKQIDDHVAGLAFLGGTMSVNDPLDWVADEVALIKLAHQKQFPVLGNCLGSQLISKALGGRVSPMDRKEIGWHPIQFLDSEIALDWKGKIPDKTKIMLWHHDEFTIPEGATPLYTTANCRNQAFAIDKMVATVAHIELSSTVLKEWLEIYGYDIEANGDSVQAIEQIKEDIDGKMAEMHVLSDMFYIKWLKLVYPREENPEVYDRLESYLKTGGCLCGGVSFFLKHARDVVNCHCEECRKFHGNHAAFTKVSDGDIYILGCENINWHHSEKTRTKRGFCRKCGSSLFWRKSADNGVCVAAGALNVPTGLSTVKNVYTDYASDFYSIDEGLDSYPTTMEEGYGGSRMCC